MRNLFKISVWKNEMGIPTFFKSILHNNRKVLSGAVPPNPDFFFIDFNSIIYDAWAKISQRGHPAHIIQDKLVEQVILQTCEMISLVNPREYTYISMDGTAPRAKMVQQRSRRYKSVQLKELTAAYNPPADFDPSPNITPGTKFMQKLGVALKKVMASGTIGSVFMSDSSVPGEGEHKFLPRIKNLARQGATKDSTVVIYSPDGDMISLSLLTHKKNVYIMRIPDPQSEFERGFCETYGYIFCNLNLVRSDFYQELISTYKESNIDELKILTDYNFLLSMVGNDFVPSMHFMKIRSGGLRLLITIYNQLREKHKQYLIHYDPMVDIQPSINMDFFVDLILQLSIRESAELRKTQTMIQRELSGHISQRVAETERDMTPEQVHCSRLEHLPLCNPMNPLHSQYKDDFKKIDFHSDKHKWKNEYYGHFVNTLSTDEDYNAVRTAMVQNYFESLVFTLRYYLTGCPSWRWYYRYRVSPIPSDMYTVLTRFRFNLNTMQFDVGMPYTPFQQLMYILPPHMKHLLPTSLGDLMTTYSHLYPESFRVDALAGLKYIYSEAILPELDDESLMEAIRNVEKTLSSAERERNTLHTKILVKRCQ